MMIISQNIIIRPKLTSLYLLTIAAIISVPPVLPFAVKAKPIPLPQKIAPRIQAINGWSCNN